MTGLSSLIFGNAASKILALAREIMFAALFGTSGTAAAYRIALSGFTIPIQATLGDVLSVGILPLYNKYRSEDPVRARALIALILTVGGVFSSAISVVLYFFADFVVSTIAPGTDGEIRLQAIAMLKILALAAPLYVLGGTLSHIEAAHNNFYAIALRPIIINIVSILGSIAAYYFGYYIWLAIALLCGYGFFFFQSMVGFLKIKDPAIAVQPPAVSCIIDAARGAIMYIAPLIALPFLAQGNLFLERIVSSWIGAPIIPSADYARFTVDTLVNVLSLPFSVFTLARFGGAKPDELSRHVGSMLTGLAAMSLPISILIAWYPHEIVSMLFERGSFGRESVDITASILRWFGLSLWLNVCSYYLVRVLNASMRVISAIAITLCAAVFSSVFNFTFWDSLGPATVGIGVLINTATIFLLSFVRLGLLRNSVHVALVLAGGVVAQILVFWAIAVSFNGARVEFFAAIIGTVLVWSPIAFFDLHIKTALAPVIGPAIKILLKIKMFIIRW